MNHSLFKPKNFAFLVCPHELHYFAGVIHYLPKDMFDIFIGSNVENAKELSELPCYIQDAIEKFQDEGYTVYSRKKLEVAKYLNMMATANFFYLNQTVFDWDKVTKCKTAMMMHASDDVFGFQDWKAYYYLFASKKQLSYRHEYKYFKDSQKEEFEKIMSLPRKMIDEFAYTGPFHIGEWEQKRLLPKDQLKAELEDVLQTKLPSNKPVVAFLEDEFCNRRQVKKALAKLAPHITLIVKPLWGIEAPPGAYNWPDQAMSPNLLRFATDFILCGYHSGTLVSSTMLNLKVIPFYTGIVYNYNTGTKPRSYKIYMPRYCESMNAAVDVLDQINPPLDLLDTQSVLDRIEDKNWWTHYENLLPVVQKNIFGDYIINGAAAKTASLLVRAFVRGSFGKDASAVRIRKEFWV